MAPRDHRIKRKDLDEDPASMDTESGSVKPSCSSSALDAISEAPEDEDMISQVNKTFKIMAENLDGSLPFKSI